MSQLPLIRLRPTDPDFLGTQAFDSGSIFYDSAKNTLILMDGRTRGGHELLKSDLSNIASGNLSFGLSSITAGAFIGDGSQLTNLPIPSNIATQSYVDTAVSTAINTKATTATVSTRVKFLFIISCFLLFVVTLTELLVLKLQFFLK
jgi:hypothetical protein